MKTIDQMMRCYGGGGSFGHFIDPLGLTVGKGKGGGAKNAWDPLNLFTSDKGNSAAAAINSAPIPTPAPPITAANQAVLMAEHDYAAQNLLKKSIAKTILAGDTGGYQAGAPSPGGSYKAKQG